MKRHYWPKTFSVYHWGFVEGHPCAAAVAWSARASSFIRRTTQETQSLFWRFADGSVRMDCFVNTHPGTYAFWTEELVCSAKQVIIIDRIAQKACATESKRLTLSKQPDQQAHVRYLVKRGPPSLKYLFDERLQIPLYGEAQYEGLTLKWEVIALAEAAFTGKLIESDSVENTCRVLPFQTADRDAIRKVTLADSSIQELCAKFNLSDLTSSWIKVR